MIACYTGEHPDFSLRALLEDCIHRVVDKDQKPLLHWVRFGGSFREIFGKIELKMDLTHAEVVVPQAQSIFDDLFQANRGAFRLVLARKAQKILNNAMGTLGLFVKFFGVSEGLWT